MIILKIFILFFIIFLSLNTTYSQEKRGGIVLSFDDGYPSWIEIVAPELQKLGGKATAFVNNKKIKNNNISYEDLRILQNKYGWEIGTHTYNHFDAIDYVNKNGLDKWINNEIKASVDELTSNDIRVYSFVFPFNRFTDDLASIISKSFESYRKDENIPLADGKRADGSIPGTAFDLRNYKPLEKIKKWIDFAYSQNKFLFLYGHEVLKDDEFFKGKITSINENIITTDKSVEIKRKFDLCIVLNTNSVEGTSSFRVKNIKENIIYNRN